MQQYRQLSLDNKLQLWQQLKENEGWQVLREMLLEDMVALPEITGLDSEKAYISKSIKISAKAGFMQWPDDIMTGLKRSKN